MPELTRQNIEQITNEIIKQEVSCSQLLDELIDHICCDVEDEMLHGLTFADAYNKVQLKIGPDRFSQIQKDTLYAIDHKYRNMKNLMKISGIAGTILFGTAALFRIQHWPHAGKLMTLGGLILIFLFLPSALSVLWKETHNRKRVFVFISGFVAGASLIAGALFKAQHWPGTGYLITISFIAWVFMFLPAVLYDTLRVEESKKTKSAIIVGVTGLILYNLGFLIKVHNSTLASILIMLGTVVMGFIALPWYTRLTWSESKTVHPRFIFFIIAFLAVIVPGILINLNMQDGDQDKRIKASAPSGKIEQPVK